MLEGGEKDDLGGVGRRDDGSVGVELDRIRLGSEVEAGGVVHSLLGLVVEALIKDR